MKNSDRSRLQGAKHKTYSSSSTKPTNFNKDTVKNVHIASKAKHDEFDCDVLHVYYFGKRHMPNLCFNFRNRHWIVH